MGNDNKIMMNCDPKSATNMYTKKKWLTVALLFCIGAGAHAQQSVQFSQYIFNGISVNPAYAGYKDVMNLNAMYRQQWSGFPGAPTTGSVSFDGPLRKPNKPTNVGLGVQAMMDNLGPQKAISLYGSYSYRIRLDEEDTKRFCIGIGVGATQYSMNGSVLEYLDTGDRIIPDGSANAITPDARVGVYYYTPNFYFGLSVLDLFSKFSSTGYKWRGYTYESIRRKQHLYVTAGYMFKVTDEISIKPSFLLKDDFAGPTSADFTLMLHMDQLLWIGGSYRTRVPLWKKKALQATLDQADAVSAILEYYITPKYRIGYSYDVNMTKMPGGSHELSIGILFNSKSYTTSNPRYF
jgi:type IX secretion system PorP/SprF family membrane protein